MLTFLFLCSCLSSFSVNTHLLICTEDITWQLFRHCTLPVLLGSGGNYGSTDKKREVKVYDQTVNDGYFEFKIVDSYGDGLCCGNGFGGYTITYGAIEIEDDFEGNNQGPFEAIQSFGDKSKCGVRCFFFSLNSGGMCLLLSIFSYFSGCCCHECKNHIC